MVLPCGHGRRRSARGPWLRYAHGHVRLGLIKRVDGGTACTMHARCGTVRRVRAGLGHIFPPPPSDSHMLGRKSGLTWHWYEPDGAVTGCPVDTCWKWGNASQTSSLVGQPATYIVRCPAAMRVPCGVPRRPTHRFVEVRYPRWRVQLGGGGGVVTEPSSTLAASTALGGLLVNDAQRSRTARGVRFPRN